MDSKSLYLILILICCSIVSNKSNHKYHYIDLEWEYEQADLQRFDSIKEEAFVQEKNILTKGLQFKAKESYEDKIDTKIDEDNNLDSSAIMLEKIRQEANNNITTIIVKSLIYSGIILAVFFLCVYV